MADDNGFPPRGAEAFDRNTPQAIESRVAQELVMASYAFGSTTLRTDLQDEADDLGIPFVMPAPEASLSRLALPTDQRQLDELTRIVRSELGLSADPEDQGFRNDEDAFARTALWSAVERTRRPEVLLALLNDRRRSASDLERVAVSLALHTVPFAEYEDARTTLEAGLYSESAEAEMLSRVGLSVPGDDARHDVPVGRGAGGLTHEPWAPSRVSVAIHGTWGRLQRERWYAPEGALHRLLRADAARDLYGDADYFRWTGGYSTAERLQGAADLYTWSARRGVLRVDTVFAHSHGGNVALSAAAAGIRIDLLVLLHTPAIRRSAAEWERIRANVRHVVVMRTRLDRVVIADGLVNHSAQSFDQCDLPHRQLKPHVRDSRGWFSHGTFIEEGNWREWDLAREVVYERSMSRPPD